MGYIDSPEEILYPVEHYFVTGTHAHIDVVHALPFSRTTNASLAGLFTVCLLLHFWQGIKCRSWGFSMLVVIGCLGEIIGRLQRSYMYCSAEST